jgi:bud site selection protein 31
MPKIKTKRSREPAGFEVLAPTLQELESRMRAGAHSPRAPPSARSLSSPCPPPLHAPHAAESESHEGKRKCESLWPIIRISHQRSRYVFDMFYQRKLISREVYDYCIKEGYADAALIAKWRKDGYDRLCCLPCASNRAHNFGATCICRVPRKDLDRGKIVECPACGCRGCASGDANAVAHAPGEVGGEEVLQNAQPSHGEPLLRSSEGQRQPQSAAEDGAG